jgi:probable HAF family extracellular repeat protein
MRPIKFILLVFSLVMLACYGAAPAGARPGPGGNAGSGPGSQNGSALEETRQLAEPLYTVQDLGTLEGGSTYGRAVNSAGQVTGWSTTGAGQVYERAFFWQESLMQALPVMGGNPALSIGYSINEAGQVAGYSSAPGGNSRAVLWSGGGLSDLGTLGGRNSAALHVNDNGQMVGWSEFNPDSGARRAAIWSGGLSALAQVGNYDAAWSINNSGKAVGECTTIGSTSDVTQPCAWPGGVLAVLGGSQGLARDINDAGTIAGWSEITAIDHKGGHIPHAVIWDADGIHDLGTLPGGTLTSRANAINASGQVVGAGTITSDLATGATHAVLWEAGQVIDLNNCIPADSGWVLTEAYGINDTGQIVGTGGHNGVYYRAFLLTPTTQALVTLAGPGAGLAGQSYTYTASVPASLSQPIQYTWTATGQAGSSESGGLTSSRSYSWAQTGSKTVNTAVISTLGTQGSASFAVDIGDVLVQPPDGSSAQIDFTFAPNRTINISIPAGAAPGGTQLLFTALPQPPAGATYAFAGMAFKLDAYWNDQRQEGFIFNQPVPVTMHFTAADVAGLDESDIRLYYQKDSGWTDAAQTCQPASPYVRNLAEHTLSVDVCHLSTFATWTVDETYRFLPQVMKK